MDASPIIHDLQMIVQQTNAAFRKIAAICPHRLLLKARSHEEADGWACKHTKGNGAYSDEVACCLNNCPLP